jgi:hypothetical protein
VKRKVKCTWLFSILVGVVALALVGLAAVPAGADVTPPDLTVCDGINACQAPQSFCDAEGFLVTLKSFTPAAPTNSGKATYVYEICEPVAGTCSTTTTQSCLDNSQCPSGEICSRNCAVDKFHGLSHFDVGFPLLADTSCLSGTNEVTGSCAVVDNAPTGDGSTVGGFMIGDGSCFGNSCNVTSTGTCARPAGTSGGTPKVCSNNTELTCSNADDCNVGTCALTPEVSCQTNGNCGPTPVAKCDNTNLNPGDCVVMTLEIAGETSSLGVGPIVLVSKDSTTCEATCGAGPSCNACQELEDGEACLTRTIGFWGTHPWITNDYDPVTVCSKSLDCSGADDGKSNPSCPAGSCSSIMEGLGSIPGELKTNGPYVAMVRQLTAAKLNLAATAILSPGATCSSWTYLDMTIQQWLAFYDTATMCSANKATISGSGCIEALDTFNNSEDNGFEQTPAPFDRPSVDDFGNISGADPTGFVAAHGNTNPPGKWVIGKNINNGGQCQ